jgi:hypothetical protein
LLLRLDKPAPALAQFSALPMSGQIMPPARIHLYGQSAATAAKDLGATRQGWLSQPSPLPLAFT